MMGQQAGSQDRLFYSFNLDDHVLPDHLLRRIDRVLDLSMLRAHLAEFYSHTGRLSVDPELMVRMLIVGYCFGIRSERRLCEEVHLNLAYRWFCRFGLEDPVPEHSTFAKNRCCPNTPFRKITRSIHESSRDVARRIGATEQYQRSRNERKKVEMLFAHLKRILRLDRLRLRALSGAADEFTMAAFAQNLRRLAKLLPPGPPGACIGVPA